MLAFAVPIDTEASVQGSPPFCDRHGQEDISIPRSKLGVLAAPQEHAMQREAASDTASAAMLPAQQVQVIDQTQLRMYAPRKPEDALGRQAAPPSFEAASGQQLRQEVSGALVSAQGCAAVA